MAKRKGSKWQRGHRPLNMHSIAPGGISSGLVQRNGREFHVRYISGQAADKSYTCPGCRLTIGPGTAHVVAWPADSIFGDEHGASERRHWHAHCWKIGP